MATFEDKDSRPWTLTIDVGAMRRVRNDLSINLADMLVLGKSADTDEPLMKRLAHDTVLLVDLLFVLCKPQCKERNMVDEQFAAIFDGPSIEKAAAALIRALNDFFQNPASRLVMKTSARVMELRDKATISDEKLDLLIDKALTQAVANQFGTTSSSLPGSPASIPSGSPPAN